MMMVRCMRGTFKFQIFLLLIRELMKFYRGVIKLFVKHTFHLVFRNLLSLCLLTRPEAKIGGQ